MTHPADHFQIEDIKNPFWREFVEKFGTDPFFYLCEMKGGDRTPYLPTMDSVMLKARDRMIRNGSDTEASLSPRRLREIKSNNSSTGNAGNVSG